MGTRSKANLSKKKKGEKLSDSHSATAREKRSRCYLEKQFLKREESWSEEQAYRKRRGFHYKKLDLPID